MLLLSLISFNLSFAQNGPVCFTDQTAADFSLGSTGTSLFVSQNNNGSVTLKPALFEDFSGNSIPAGWTNENFDPSGTTTFDGNTVEVNGTHIVTNSSFGPGSALEFEATFNYGAYQNVGLSFDQAFNTPWITIGQGSPDGNVYARFSDGPAISLGPLLGSSHHYRLQWNANSFDILVDGGVSATVSINFTVNDNMYVQISDLLTGDGDLHVDWIRVTPYITTGTFTSRVFDAGGIRQWTNVNWNADVYPSNDVVVRVRTGNTSTPNASWSNFVVAPSGYVLNATSRYIQYEVVMTTTDGYVSPSFNDISISCQNATPVVSTHPEAASVCAGGTATFTSAATGATSVQWQSSSNGNTWTNIGGATSGTLSFTAVAGDNGKQYRAVWTNGAGSVESDPATLTVKPLPTLTSSTSQSVTSGSAFVYTATSSVAGTSFSWTRAQVAGISNTAASGNGSINETLVNTTSSPVVVNYVYSLSANGCNGSGTVSVTVDPLVSDCIVSSSSTQHFNNYAVSSGTYLWFNSSFKAKNIGSGPVNIYITNSRISYKINNVTYTVNVPNSHIQFVNNVWLPSTDYTSAGWKTKVNAGFDDNVFMTGHAYKLPHNLPKGVKNVTWTMDIRIDKPNVKIDWKWSATAYSRFNTNSNLEVKPTDGLLSFLSPFVTISDAGTPLNYALYAIPGGTTTGLLNLGSPYSSNNAINCNAIVQNAMTPMFEEGVVTEEAAGELAVKAFPNPTTSSFNLSISGGNGKPVSVRVVDITGRMVQGFERVASGSRLTVGQNWKPGSYFIEVNGGDQRKVVKVIKVN